MPKCTGMDPIWKKLQYKGQDSVAILNLPEELNLLLSDTLASNVSIRIEPRETYDFVILFAKTRAELQSEFGSVRNVLTPKAILWCAYPKKSSKKYRSDITRDAGWEPLGDAGMEPVSQIALNDDWSALRFKKVEDIPVMKRRESMRISEQGKKRKSDT